MWDEQVAELAGSYQVIRYDLRGLGRSARPAGPYRMADDALAVLDHLGVAAAAVVGFPRAASSRWSWPSATPSA